MEMLATEIAGQMGSIDGLINNAGVIQTLLPMLELTVEQIERVLRINLHGAIYMCRAFTHTVAGISRENDPSSCACPYKRVWDLICMSMYSQPRLAKTRGRVVKF